MQARRVLTAPAPFRLYRCALLVLVFVSVLAIGVVVPVQKAEAFVDPSQLFFPASVGAGTFTAGAGITAGQALGVGGALAGGATTIGAVAAAGALGFAAGYYGGKFALSFVDGVNRTMGVDYWCTNGGGNFIRMHWPENGAGMHGGKRWLNNVDPTPTVPVPDCKKLTGGQTFGSNGTLNVMPLELADGSLETFALECENCVAPGNSANGQWFLAGFMAYYATGSCETSLQTSTNSCQDSTYKDIYRWFLPGTSPTCNASNPVRYFAYGSGCTAPTIDQTTPNLDKGVLSPGGIGTEVGVQYLAEGQTEWQPCKSNRAACHKYATEPVPNTQYRCAWGATVLTLSECAALEEAYAQPITEPSADPSASASPGAGGLPSTGTTPDPVRADLPAGNVDYGGCMGGFWSWNPTDWVAVPVKCTLQFLFVPSEGTVQAAYDGIGTSWTATRIPEWGGALTGVGSDVAGMGSDGGCSGPHFSFSVMDNDFDMEPINACAPPLSQAANVAKIILSVVVIVATARACARVLFSSMSMGDAA